MGEKRGTKALESWCRRITEGYKDVSVDNMTTSWRNGLAFCAIIHHFRPDLINFDSLSKDNIFHNNELAFRTAEMHLNIPALLDAEDMVKYEIPDRLSILTYLSQYYQALAGHQNNSVLSRSPNKRSSSTVNQVNAEESPPVKLSATAGLGRSREPCVSCGMPVFIAERLLVNSHLLFHRSCFRCARCNHQMSTANYYETEEGKYCCETCPDEVAGMLASPSPPSSPHDSYSSKIEFEIDKQLIEDTQVKDTEDYKSKLTQNVILPKSLVKMRMKIFENSNDGKERIPQNRYGFFRKSSEEEKQSKTEENLRTHSQNEPKTISTDVQKLEIPEVINCELDEARISSKPVESGDKVEVVPMKDTLDSNEARISSKPVESSDKVEVVPMKDTLDSNEARISSKPVESSDKVEVVPMKDTFDSNAEGKETSVKECIDTKDSEIDENLENVSTSTEKAEVQEKHYPEGLNPFGDDDDEEEGGGGGGAKQKYENPFGSSDEEGSLNMPVTSTTTSSPKPRKLVKAPDFSGNPFWSDDEEATSEDESTDKKPVPLPRTPARLNATPEPMPRKISGLSSISGGAFGGSTTSLSSMCSSSGSSARKKKKPAPPPPSFKELFPPALSVESSRSTSPSPNMGTNFRKSRPAPPPPLPTSPPPSASAELEKTEKDEENKHRQSQRKSLCDVPPTTPNKSTFGQWKRKKGPAPPLPVPQRRQIKQMPMNEVKQELDDIEVKQQELERQGVNLERTIRGKFAEEDANMLPDVEDFVLQLFELVNEKNELFRRQAELMYLRRQQRLEEEHADLEYQIRCLMDCPEHMKTDLDKAREEDLILRLVDVVERRNEIVECLEMDRIREAEEDHSIHTQLGLFAEKNRISSTKKGSKEYSKYVKKEKKLKKPSKKSNKCSKLDADKDVDDTEPLEEKKIKKKWFL